MGKNPWNGAAMFLVTAAIYWHKPCKIWSPLQSAPPAIHPRNTIDPTPGFGLLKSTTMIVIQNRVAGGHVASSDAKIAAITMARPMR